MAVAQSEVTAGLLSVPLISGVAVHGVSDLQIIIVVCVMPFIGKLFDL